MRDQSLYELPEFFDQSVVFALSRASRPGLIVGLLHTLCIGLCSAQRFHAEGGAQTCRVGCPDEPDSFTLQRMSSALQLVCFSMGQATERPSFPQFNHPGFLRSLQHGIVVTGHANHRVVHNSALVWQAATSDVIAPGPQWFFARSVVLGLVCRLSLPGLHLQEGKDLTTCGAEAPLPQRVLRDIPDETVKALVDGLVTSWMSKHSGTLPTRSAHLRSSKLSLKRPENGQFASSHARRLTAWEQSC